MTHARCRPIGTSGTIKKHGRPPNGNDRPPNAIDCPRGGKRAVVPRDTLLGERGGGIIVSGTPSQERFNGGPTGFVRKQTRALTVRAYGQKRVFYAPSEYQIRAGDCFVGTDDDICPPGKQNYFRLLDARNIAPSRRRTTALRRFRIYEKYAHLIATHLRNVPVNIAGRSP